MIVFIYAHTVICYDIIQGELRSSDIHHDTAAW